MGSALDQAVALAWRGSRARPVRLNGALVYPQLNNWSCGPMALRYCLMAYGLDVDPRSIARLARSTRAGTGQYSMQAAAFKLGFDLRFTDALTAKDAKLLIDSSLALGRPVVLSVDKWQHWVACLGHTRAGYLVMDSSRPGPVIQLHGWRRVQKRLRHYPRESQHVIYSFAALTPRPVQIPQ